MSQVMRLGTMLAVALSVGWAVGAGLKARRSLVEATAVTSQIEKTVDRPSQTPTLREVLTPYVGNRMAEYEERAASEGKSLDDPADLSILPPWEDVAEEVADLVLAPEPADKRFRKWLLWKDEQMTGDVDFRLPFFNPSGVALSKENLAQVRAVAEGHDKRILDLAEVEGIRKHEALQDLVSRGKIDHVPFFFARYVRNPFRPEHVANSLFHRNWAITVSLKEGDSPSYDEIVRLLTQARAERLQAVRDKIKEIRKGA